MERELEIGENKQHQQHTSTNLFFLHHLLLIFSLNHFIKHLVGMNERKRGPKKWFSTR
ncbi:hypothetical protein QJS04_geneDACA016189 [Acorus gramineus]|uniref:Uncharacterized protein n=1 Tax=Acorus gramineus TaxID=55184 RepID=A0AAV9B198_ACOGR|nr:hypothetical protein QJS04_geneDACA016189 [Acorus gramineus]